MLNTSPLTGKQQLIREMRRVDGVTQRILQTWTNFSATAQKLKRIRSEMLLASRALESGNETEIANAYFTLVMIVDERLN